MSMPSELVEHVQVGERRLGRKALGRPGDSRPPRNSRSAYRKLKAQGDDQEARRLCAVILEVLGGGRTPMDAASALGVSIPRYYALEARALGGLLEACGRRAKGRQRTPKAELEKLRWEVKRLEGQCGRLQALLRASQRVVGLSPPSPSKSKPADSQKRHRKRRPVVRALRAAKTLRSVVVENSVEGTAETKENPLEVKA